MYAVRINGKIMRYQHHFSVSLHLDVKHAKPYHLRKLSFLDFILLKNIVSIGGTSLGDVGGRRCSTCLCQNSLGQHFQSQKDLTGFSWKTGGSVAGLPVLNLRNQ